MSTVVHGDDFWALGPNAELAKPESKMKEWYDAKTRGNLGPEKIVEKEIKISNRKVEWGDLRGEREEHPRGGEGFGAWRSRLRALTWRR